MGAMGTVKTILTVRGMHCPACEKRIEGAIGALAGVVSASAEYRKGRVTVEYDSRLLTEDSIRSALSEAGYEPLSPRAAALRKTALGLALGAAAVALYLAVEAAGGFSLLPKIDSSLSYGMLFLAGILTSFHCVAMCGGIALSQGLPRSGAESGEGAAARLLPGLLYNAGRLVSYTAMGAAAGALGSVFDFSPMARALVMGAAGLFMILFGLRALGLFRALPLPSLPTPPFLRAAAAKVAGRSPLLVGLLNALIPCGPLQSMQLYALGTGSAVSGAAAMFLFCLGTIPLLLGFGSVAAFLPKRRLSLVTQAGAVLLLFLGLVTASRAVALSGYAPGGSTLRPGPQAKGNPAGKPAGSPAGIPADIPRAVVDGQVQRVTTEFSSNRYAPFVVRAGIPVEWTIRIAEKDLNGCNNPFVVPAYGLRITLKPGDNIVRFTPGTAGTVPYSCWMGMIRSAFLVVDGESSEAALGSPAFAGLDQLQSSSGSACSCCAGE